MFAPQGTSRIVPAMRVLMLPLLQVGVNQPRHIKAGLQYCCQLAVIARYRRAY
jgi:hypothetical protein